MDPSGPRISRFAAGDPPPTVRAAEAAQIPGKEHGQDWGSAPAAQRPVPPPTPQRPPVRALCTRSDQESPAIAGQGGRLRSAQAVSAVGRRLTGKCGADGLIGVTGYPAGRAAAGPAGVHQRADALFGVG
jgi:hypothetical protein